MFALASKFLHHVVPGIARPMRVLWNEVIGFLFFALAVPALFSAIKTVHGFDGAGSSVLKLVITTVFALLMLGFGISSFLRARKIARS